MMSEEYDPGSSGAEDPCGRKRRRRAGGISLGGGRLFPGLKEFVVHLLTFRSESYSDTDFAERTLMNLGRKITKYGDSELSEWEKCVRLRDPNTGCVRVARPRDSRMAVSRTPGGGVKKVYPAIIVSQIFRFPQVVFHNDIRSVRECAHQAPVKKERPPAEENEDLICVNPYHYEMTLEAYARLKKKASKPQSQWQNKNGKRASNNNNNNNNSSSNNNHSSSSSNNNHSSSSAINNSHGRIAPGSSSNNSTAVVPAAAASNHSETTSSNTSTSEPSSTPRPFIESELLRDLQFYDLNKRKAIQDLESLKLLGIRNGIRSVVKDKYPKLPVHHSHHHHQDSDAPPVDEGLIQNLLEDIRGSFERQFDDDLNALAASSSVMSGSFYHHHHHHHSQEPTAAASAGATSPWVPSGAHQASTPGGGHPAAAAAAVAEWNTSNYLNVDFDHYFTPPGGAPPGGGPHIHPPHLPHPMSAYHHLHHHHAAAAAAAASQAAAAASNNTAQSPFNYNNSSSSASSTSSSSTQNAAPPLPSATPNRSSSNSYSSSSSPYNAAAAAAAASAAAYGSLQ